PPPTVTLTRATPADHDRLANLLQLYFYDFSEFTDDAEARVDDTGRFPAYDDLISYLDQPDHRAYLIHADGRLAGFALVRRLDRPSREPTWGMQEFFVLRHERRQGVGQASARAIFDQLPGRWEVGEIRANRGAIAFWRRVIAIYTGGRFSDEGADDPDMPGPLQIFRAPPGG
ncbi:MAG: GNAT family N-acetyltransferase, partial [Chloroflexi bacterium]|nr:GNAT family N-acetyltransferase [Chloroflexota bacterium]